jgi:hypothetical protein
MTANKKIMIDLNLNVVDVWFGVKVKKRN